MPARLKKLIIFSISAIAIALVVFFIVRERRYRDLDPLVGPQLKALVKAGSGGLYFLEYDSIHADLGHSSLYLKNVRIRPDSVQLKRKEKNGTLGNDVFLLDVSSLRINNINIDALVRGRGIDLSDLVIDSPVVRFFHRSRNTSINSRREKDDEELYDKIRKKANRVQVNNILLNDVTLLYCNQNKNNKMTEIRNVDLHFRDLEISERTRNDKQRFFFASNATISMGRFSYRTSDSLYTIQWDSLKLDAATKQMQLKGLHYHPHRDKETMTALTGRSMYDLELSELLLKNIDWWQLAWEEGLQADTAIIRKGAFYIYNNKLNNIRKNKKGNYPHQLLQSADMPIDIRTLLLDSLDLTYEDMNVRSEMMGTIRLTDVHGKGSNIRNLQSRRNAGRYMKLNINSNFMGLAPLYMNLYYDLDDINDGAFVANVRIDGLDVAKINTITVPLGMMNVKHLYVEKLLADINGNNEGAESKVYFKYRDLDVVLLKRDKLKDRLRERKFFTYIANNVLFKRSNTNEAVAVVKTYYKRTLDQSFFGLLWRSILKGITETAKKK